MKSLIFTEIIFCPGLDFLFNDIWKTRQTGRVPYAPVIEWFTKSEAVPSFYWPFCRHLLFYWAFPWVTVWLTKICFYADAMSMLGWVSALCGYPWKLRKQKILKSKNSFYAHFWTKTGDFFLKRWKTTNILPQIFFSVKNVKKNRHFMP